MTSKHRLDAVTTVTTVLHDVLCVPGARHRSDWTPEHMRVDRTRASAVYSELVQAGLLPGAAVLSDDFLAAS